MKIIFVPVTDKPECAIALQQAFKLGEHLEASVKGCHIRAHQKSKVAFPVDTTSINGDDQKIQEKDQSAKNLFAGLASENNYTFLKKQSDKTGALWLEMKGTPEKLFSIVGPISDLIVVSRPAKKGKSLSRKFMMSAIMKSARPVIVLPQTQVPEIGQSISIAWNQSPQAIHAIAAAMPLLVRAKQVNILTCKPENKVGPKAKQLIQYLQSWNIKATHVISKGSNDAKALLTGYNKTKSDLLVMGGYSHNRLKQQIFGGVTEYMLNKANIPVFMLHSI